MPRFITALQDVNRAGEDSLVLSSVEVRWFFQGKIPAKLRSWFRKLPAKAAPQPLRVDHYILEHDTDALGVKLREGRIEVKQRQGEALLTEFGPGLVGYVEHWLKWSFPLVDAERSGRALKSSAHWIAVQKKRRVITYSISPRGKLIALSGEAGVERGCSVELTQVRVKNALWWSLGFEAKGQPESLDSTLEQVARVVLDGSESLGFESTDSFGYPRWLQVWNQDAGASK